MTWQDYQVDVADFFRSLGCTVEVEATVQGIRTRHMVDVWALNERFGLFTRWVVECKNWKTAVPKEKVLALRSIVDDLGADRGFIVNENGFQSGAYEAAESTNISVTTLRDLAERASEGLAQLHLDEADRRLTSFHLRTTGLWLVTERTRDSQIHRLRDGVVDTEGVVARLGVLAAAESAVARARIDKFPVVVPSADGSALGRSNSAEETAERVSDFVHDFETWLAEQEAGVGAAGGWDLDHA
jgi:hypothetical protein